MDVVVFEHFQVRPDRIVASVRITDERWAYATPQVAMRLHQRFPHILQHACVNDCGPTFGAVASHTSTPHVLEHVVISLQALRETPGSSPITYVGKTYWTDRSALRACVEVNYRNDLVALGAFKDGAALLAEIWPTPPSDA